MIRKCPVCAGTGVPLDKYSRQIHFGDGKYEDVSCWMCSGRGEVEEVPATKRSHIQKYWNQVEEVDNVE